VPADDERHTLVVVRDLSHLRETEQSLAMSEAQWQAVLAALPDLIVINDETGRCVGAHASPHSSIVVNTALLLGHRASDLLAPEDAARLEAARRRALETTLPEVCETRVTWQGRAGWVESRVVPLGSDRTLSVMRDVTERRALQDQLRQAQRLEAIGRLAGGVAHDFNNLLTVIGGATELAVDGMPPWDPNRRILQEAREATMRAAQLTQQLLAFGRRQVLQAEVFDVREVVRGCEPMLRRLIGEHIQLTCQLGQHVPCVHADRRQIEQVLVNLAVNARDAMSAGGQLTIRVEATELTEKQCRGHQLRPGPTVAVSVIDTGAGIPAAALEHVFEPLFTTKESGERLGLPTVYGIVQQSGGCVTVSSRVGTGTVFAVHLPAVTKAVKARPVRPPVSVADPCGEETVLLAEDEPAVREVTLRFLQTAGYRVVAAESGDEALALLNRLDRPVDLLLTDVVMPGMSGPKLATRVQHRHPGVRVLFMSGYPDDALHAHQMPEDATAFIQKPFSRQSLLTAVRGALSPASASL
jgi:signal transduction histidine kinase/ActR/RegA family two-component response regulator